MTNLSPTSHLPDIAIREFETAREFDWKDGVSLPMLLDRINRVAESFLPDQDASGSVEGRVKRLFTERSFRHYQTLGCIDVPEREGRRAIYGHRHFVQALLVRRLLWERVSADRIVGLMVSRSLEEAQGMFLHGVEFVARTAEKISDPAPISMRIASRPAQKWNRLQIAPGVELHLSSELTRFQPTELQRLLELLEQALREVVY